MLQFTLFGIPVRIQPWFWLTCFLLSGTLHAAPGQAMLQRLIIWTGVVLISILVHELGHAITGLKLGGGAAIIELNAFGGLAYNHGGRFSDSGRRWMIAMGPGAGFMLAGLTFVAMVAIDGFTNASAITQLAVAGNVFTPWNHLESKILDQPGLLLLFYNLLWVNIWWGILNLMPILPLDGGKLYATFSKSPRRTFLVGVVTGSVLALYGFANQHFLLGMFMGLMAFNNYQQMQQASH